MSEVAVEKFPNRQSLSVGQTVLAGRIDQVRRFGKYWLHRLILPSVDSFSQPSYVEVQADNRLGSVGDDFKGVVRISGIRNSFEVTDRATGERQRVNSARNFLIVVE